MSGKTNCGTAIQWNTNYSAKQTKNISALEALPGSSYSFRQMHLDANGLEPTE